MSRLRRQQRSIRGIAFYTRQRQLFESTAVGATEHPANEHNAMVPRDRWHETLQGA